ncbi:hypothetical protein EON67_10650 [archaeon]|nr:MAG: hypothetical protein EON67_10650 [archaeon]
MSVRACMCCLWSDERAHCCTLRACAATLERDMRVVQVVKTCLPPPFRLLARAPLLPIIFTNLICRLGAQA